MGRLGVMVLGCFALTVGIWALNVARFKHNSVSAKELRSIKRSKDINEGTPPPITIMPVNVVKEKKIQRVTPPEKAQPKGKRRPKGVTVNRRAIVENVTLEDLRAPEGRLWIPAAIVGPVTPEASDPFINVAVAYCQLDMTSYHETPWLFAMGTFHQLHSGCLSDPSLVKTYRLSSLAAIVDENPDEFLDPTGFIYHETRCGSTLSANMLAAVPSNIVHSETPPPVVAVNMCSSKCSDELRGRLVRTVFRLMGPAHHGHTHLFFKFQNSKYLTNVEKAWPDVKWVYLFRDPLEVMASNLKGAWRKNQVKRETPGSPDGSRPEYFLGGPCVRAIAKHKRGANKEKDPPSELLASECARQLETLNEAALHQIRNGSPNALVVDYRQLPEAFTEYVYPVHFGMAKSQGERDTFKTWMEPITHMYSKGMANGQEPTFSKEYKQGMDIAGKEEGSDETMRQAAEGMCDTYRTMVEMQRWLKEREGDTIGTCAR